MCIRDSNFTSRGRNHAATLYEYAAGEESWFAQRLPVTETSVFTPEQVEEIRKEMHRTYGEEDGEALFRQEYMCDLDAPVVGAYYGKLLVRAADEGRITGVPYDCLLYTSRTPKITGKGQIYFINLFKKMVES